MDELNTGFEGSERERAVTDILRDFGSMMLGLTVHVDPVCYDYEMCKCCGRDSADQRPIRRPKPRADYSQYCIDTGQVW